MSTPADEFFSSLVGDEPSKSGREFHLADALEILRRHWKLAFVLALLGLTGGIAHYLMTPKRYRASTTVLIERPSMLGTGFEANWSQYLFNQEFYPTQYKLLESRGMAERVVHSLRLYEDPDFNPSWSRFTVSGDGETPSAELDELAVARLGQKLQGNLRVQPVRGTHLVQISYDSSKPGLTARIANGVADTFAEWTQQTGAENVSRTSAFLNDYIDSLKEEIQTKETRLRELSRSGEITSDDSTSNVTLQRLEALNQDYIQAISDRIAKEARYQELLQSPAETLSPSLSGGDLVAKLRSEQLALERDYATKLDTYKPEWPEMVELKQRIDRGRQHLDEVIGDMVSGERKQAAAEYQTALRMERRLASEIETVREEILSAGSASLEYTNLKVEAETRKQLLDDLIRRQSETEVVARIQTTGGSNVRVVDRALVPGSPYYPSLKGALTGGLAVGLVLAVAAIVMLEYMDRTIKTGEEAESRLGLPVLGVVPDVSLKGRPSRYGYGYGYGLRRQHSAKRNPALRWLDRAPGQAMEIDLLPHEKSKNVVSEAYRSIRTALLLSSADEINTISVTSAGPGEGKTATAINLAVVMSQMDRKVLLVDADLRKPRLHRVFRASNRIGLVGYLAAHEDLKAGIHQTQVPGLFVLPSGPIPPNPSELLASARMDQLLEAGREHFDLLILDTPPVLPVSDAVVVGTKVDGVALILQAGKVQRDEAVSTVERLRMADVKLFGVVINRFLPTGKGKRGRHYYYYETYSEVAEGTAADSAA